MPSKDSIETMVKKPGEKFNAKENLCYTALVIFISLLLALGFTSLGSIATILGATTNTAVGFLLPIAYYLKAERKRPPVTVDKIFCYLIFGFVCFSSVTTLYFCIKDMINPDNSNKDDTDPCASYLS